MFQHIGYPVALLMRKVANKPRNLAIFLFGSLLAIAGSYALLEGAGVFDSTWWTVVTSSTVGYGDMYPTHVTGKILAMIAIFWMALLVQPLITAQIASAFIVNSDAFTHAEQELMKTQLLETLQELVATRQQNAQMMELLRTAIELMNRIYGEVDQAEELATAGNASTEQVRALLGSLALLADNTQLASVETLGRMGATFQFTPDGQLHILDAQHVDGRPVPPQPDQSGRGRRRRR